MFSQFINNIPWKNQYLLYPKSLSDTPTLEESKLPFLECCLIRDIIEKWSADPRKLVVNLASTPYRFCVSVSCTSLQWAANSHVLCKCNKLAKWNKTKWWRKNGDGMFFLKTVPRRRKVALVRSIAIWVYDAEKLFFLHFRMLSFSLYLHSSVILYSQMLISTLAHLKNTPSCVCGKIIQINSIQFFI